MNALLVTITWVLFEVVCVVSYLANAGELVR